MMLLNTNGMNLYELNNTDNQAKQLNSVDGLNTSKKDVYLEGLTYNLYALGDKHLAEELNEENKLYKLYMSDKIKVKLKFRDYTKVIGIILKITNLFNINTYCLR